MLLKALNCLNLQVFTHRTIVSTVGQRGFGLIYKMDELSEVSSGVS